MDPLLEHFHVMLHRIMQRNVIIFKCNTENQPSALEKGGDWGERGSRGVWRRGKLTVISGESSLFFPAVLNSNSNGLQCESVDGSLCTALDRL